jgi:hypothetical protein
MKLILCLVIIIAFPRAFFTDGSVVSLQAEVDDPFQEASVLKGKDNLEKITQGLILEPLMVAGSILLMTNLYYNNCYNPKLLAAGSFLTTAYGLSAVPIDGHANVFLTFTCLPVWYYLGLQAENYKKDETFSQSVSIAAKGFIVFMLLDNFLYPDNKNDTASQNTVVMCQTNKIYVSYKF